MKKLTILLLLLSITSPTLAAVSTRVCLSDGNTPFDGGDIMVGTKLTIIVSSDADGEWPCDLAIQGENRNYGLLLGRDFNESSGHYDGSIFENAIGTAGYVYLWHDDYLEIDGFSYTGDLDAVAGDWLIFDYNATNVGDCNVGLYEWFSMDPIYEIPFSHVRTRDFDNDTIVSFSDFSVLAFYWQETDCNDPNWCQGTDLDTDSDVDVNDLMLFCEYWLERTE